MSPTLKRTLGYFKPYWKLLVVSALCSSVVGGMDAGIIALTNDMYASNIRLFITVTQQAS